MHKMDSSNLDSNFNMHHSDCECDLCLTSDPNEWIIPPTPQHKKYHYFKQINSLKNLNNCSLDSGLTKNMTDIIQSNSLSPITRNHLLFRCVSPYPDSPTNLDVLGTKSPLQQDLPKLPVSYSVSSMIEYYDSSPNPASTASKCASDQHDVYQPHMSDLPCCNNDISSSDTTSDPNSWIIPPTPPRHNQRHFSISRLGYVQNGDFNLHQTDCQCDECVTTDPNNWVIPPTPPPQKARRSYRHHAKCSQDGSKEKIDNNAMPPFPLSPITKNRLLFRPVSPYPESPCLPDVLVPESQTCEL